MRSALERARHAEGILRFKLAALKASDPRGQLGTRLEPVELETRDQLEVPGREIDRVFFIETGIAAVVSVSGKEQISLGLIGCEGASGTAVILGANSSPHSTVMLNNGTAFSLTTDELRLAMERSPQLRAILLRYVLAFGNQIAHTAISNAMSSIEQRVARWVLMTHDRVAKDDVPLTHETIASMIGIRRAGVSSSLEQLQRAGLIDIERGNVRVLNLKGIRSIAGEYYGLPEKEFMKLIGTSWPPASPR